MTTKFEWDQNKNIQNINKHGISFNEAEEVFNNKFNKSRYDELSSIGEHRYLTTGVTNSGKFLLVSHTDGKVQGDNGEIIRIISARKLTRREKKKYVKSTTTDY